MNTKENILLLKSIGKIIRTNPNPWFDKYVVIMDPQLIVVVLDNIGVVADFFQLPRRVKSYVNRAVVIDAYHYDLIENPMRQYMILMDSIKNPDCTIDYITNPTMEFIEV